ncbi:tyrosine/DOPA decarboxylase 2-like [Lotus japonicus]|uniref:tyrosine/DOPA decarboxylase 2-like n=1 Tax=Lotus japonicus TaxID=34305 RepID=UPI002587BF99|nr:tyrosine/DOPA decarboxylase 2-like [Lotus japonicus]
MNPLDPKEFRKQGHMIIDFLADYYQNVANYPVLSQVEPGYLAKLLPPFAPHNPESIETILQDLQQHIIPGITHWQSPNYFAYFPSSGSTAGFLGEMISTGLNVVGFNWVSSPAATELESIVMDWLGQALKLPDAFLFKGGGGGVLLGTTCEAILATLVASRDQILHQIGSENLTKLVVYGSDQTHCSVQKAAHIVGIHPKNIRAIKTVKSKSFSLEPEALLSAIQSDVKKGLVPCYLCVTVGTTSTTAIDPIGPLCKVAKDYSMWVHVDAAYAGSACICPEFRHLIDGVEDADSFSFNAHKWFLTNLDCCCLWVKDPPSLVKFLSTNSVYLENSASETKQVVDYKDWQIPLSRRFRALKVWLVLRSYGVANLRNFLRSHVEMAKTFEELVKKDTRFEIVVPRNLAVVFFRLLPSVTTKFANGKVQNGNLIANGKVQNGNIIANGKVQNGDLKTKDVANEMNRKLLDSINGSGTVYMTHAVVGGIFVIRCAIGATLTEEMHVIKAWKVVQEHADVIIKY